MTPWTVACQAPLSMGFPRQEYWGRLPFLSPRDLPYPKIDQTRVSCIAGGFLTTEPFVWSKIYFLVTYIIWSWSSPMDHHATSIFPFPHDCCYLKTAFFSFIHTFTYIVHLSIHSPICLFFQWIFIFLGSEAQYWEKDITMKNMSKLWHSPASRNFVLCDTC